MEYYTTAELSEKWGISQRRIAILCKQDRIPGSIMKGRTWLVPEGASKPSDKRKSNNMQ